jgi:NADPH:quinone reductase-like Zn-dependent oxidoreductase
VLLDIGQIVSDAVVQRRFPLDLNKDMPQIQTILCEAISEDIGNVGLKAIELANPEPGEVQVRLKTCAVNFTDLLMIQGKYQFKPPLPFAPGTEAAGDVEAVGRDVAGIQEGDPVIIGMLTSWRLLHRAARTMSSTTRRTTVSRADFGSE